MIKAVRILKIKEILYNLGTVKVDELSDMMGVSLVTIRNDLAELEEEGFVTRTHGGAVINEKKRVGFPDFRLEKSMEDSISQNVVIPLPAERQIAYLVKQMIQDDAWIFLGCGSTCATIAQALSEKRVNVVTNSILVATMLAQNPLANVLITGGYLSGSYRSYMSGDIFEESLRNIRVDMAFFGVAAVNFDSGFSVHGLAERSIYAAVKKVSREMVMVGGSYKYGKDSYFTIANLDEPDIVIAERDIPEEYEKYFKEHGIKFIKPME